MAVETLPERERRPAHWMLDGVASFGGLPMPYYGFMELGLSARADRLVALGLFAHVKGGDYVVTEAGRKELAALTKKYGAPSYPHDGESPTS